jgi:hypothetical protein
MFETVFGSEIPLAARFFIAFLVVLALIGLTAWLVRRFGSNRLGSAARGRQPRLAVIDAASVDGRRRLVLIRRDNIEHLLMIGGPTDVVVEANIVRATGARDATKAPVIAEPTLRPAASVDTQWPLQPASEPAPLPPPAMPAPRVTRAAAIEEPWLPPEPGAKPRPADSLSGLAAELSTRLTPPDAPPRSEPRSTVAPTIQPPVEPPPTIAPPPQQDHNLAEMAQQLEAALRRAPAPESRPPVTDPLAAPPPAAPPRDFKPRAEPKFEPKFEPPRPRPEARADIKAEPKIEPALDFRAEPKPAPTKTPLDNLEEEMANLLGRPTGKT